MLPSFYMQGDTLYMNTSGTKYEVCPPGHPRYISGLLYVVDTLQREIKHLRQAVTTP